MKCTGWVWVSDTRNRGTIKQNLLKIGPESQEKIGRVQKIALKM